jgi:hypothetical protein
LGEDGRITIECHRERHRNIEGDYGTFVAAPVACATHTPSSLGVIAPHLRMVVWPCKFWPHLSEKYDGFVNPVEFLQIYNTSILAAGGNEAVIPNYFLMALAGPAQSWLINLPEASLTSWEELCRQFRANFESAYSQSDNETDIHVVQQRSGESLRSFI